MDAFIASAADAIFFGILAIAALGFVMWCIESLWGAMGNVTIHHRIADWLDAHAAPEWRIAHRLRSVQITLFWAVLGGAFIALPSFQNYLSAFHMLMISIGFSLAIAFARLTGQKGLPDA